MWEIQFYEQKQAIEQILSGLRGFNNIRIFEYSDPVHYGYEIQVIFNFNGYRIDFKFKVEELRDAYLAGTLPEIVRFKALEAFMLHNKEKRWITKSRILLKKVFDTLWQPNI